MARLPSFVTRVDNYPEDAVFDGDAAELNYADRAGDELRKALGDRT